MKVKRVRSHPSQAYYEGPSVDSKTKRQSLCKGNTKVLLSCNNLLFCSIKSMTACNLFNRIQRILILSSRGNPQNNAYATCVPTTMEFDGINLEPFGFHSFSCMCKIHNIQTCFKSSRKLRQNVCSKKN